ncbi:MAG: ATP synthase F0 subunit B [Acidobacteria bacterium]|nr:ATP synthase F0 subunit B [Acidobacteriota bacterium]
MDATLIALGGLMLKALPTFVLLVLLHFYLKFIFFRPLDKVLRARFELTEGARRSAQTSLEAAARKTAECEAALREARGEIYREQEETRRRWRDEHAAAVQQARGSAESLVAQARLQLAEDAARARESLQAESEALAARIASAILARRPS